MNSKKLKKILKKHKHWLDIDCIGWQYMKAKFIGDNLTGTRFDGVDLRGADFSLAALNNASFCGADLRYTDFFGVKIYGACLYGANLKGAKNVPYIPLECPSHGTFTGWKMVDDYIVELTIPSDAKRSSATTKKCRSDKAFVASITSLSDGTLIDKVVNNNNFATTIYKVGEMVYPDSFDEDRWNECSHGIHFFIDRQDAIDY